MITISQAVEEIIRKESFLEEGMSRGIVNYSALARIIKPQVEEKVFKNIELGAIIMALKRLEKSVLKSHDPIRDVFSRSPNMIVRSHLVEYTMMVSPSLIEKHRHFFAKIQKDHKHFFIITQGVFEAALIVSEDLQKLVEENFTDEKIISKMESLSSITIQLPPSNVTTPGLYGYILRTLGWEKINIVEVASTATELTIILKDADVDRAFTTLKRL